MAPSFLARIKGLFRKKKPEKRKKARETKEDQAQPNPLLDSQIREAAFNGTLCRELTVGKPVFAACSLPDDCPGIQDGLGLPDCCSQIVETIPVTVIDDLLSRKADINGHNHDGFTALHFAASRGVYTLHIAYCISPCIQLTTAVVGHEANIRALLTRGAKASAEDSHGNTPLHIAALNVGAWTPWDSIVESEHPQWVHVYSVHDTRTCVHVCALVQILVNTQFRRTHAHALAHTRTRTHQEAPRAVAQQMKRLKLIKPSEFARLDGDSLRVSVSVPCECVRVSKHAALTSEYLLCCTAKPGCPFGCAKTAKDMSSHPMLKCPIYTAFNVSFCHRSHSFAGFGVASMQRILRQSQDAMLRLSKHARAGECANSCLVIRAACTRVINCQLRGMHADFSQGQSKADLRQEQPWSHAC